MYWYHCWHPVDHRVIVPLPGPNADHPKVRGIQCRASDCETVQQCCLITEITALLLGPDANHPKVRGTQCRASRRTCRCWHIDHHPPVPPHSPFLSHLPAVIPPSSLPPFLSGLYAWIYEQYPSPAPPSQLPGLYAWIYEQYRILPNETVKAWAVRGGGGGGTTAP